MYGWGQDLKKNSYLDNNWPLNFLKTIIITHKETYCFTYIEAAKAGKALQVYSAKFTKIGNWKIDSAIAGP